MKEVNLMPIPRMRTINEVCVELKKQDPDSAITPYFIRKLVNEKKIVYILSGSKALINLDSVIAYLNEPEKEGYGHDIEQKNAEADIRRVPEDLKFIPKHRGAMT